MAMTRISSQGFLSEKRVVLLIAVLAGFITPFDGSAVNIALPSISAELHLDAIQLSWVATGYLLASALFLVPLGKFADIHGRKKVFLYGIGIFTAASFAMTFVMSGGMLLALRVVQGLGSSMIFGTAVAILTSVFDRGERGKALGIYITAVYLGLTAGPFIGGMLTGLFGWRSIFLINVPIGLATIGIVLTRLKGEWADSRGEKFDLTGSVLYSISLVGIMTGFSLLPSHEGLFLITGGVIAFALFYLYEQKERYPVLNLALFSKNRVFTFSSLAALINYSATYAVSFLLSLYLQYTRGFLPQYAGLVLIIAPLAQMFVSPFAGRLSDRVNPQVLATLGMGCSTVGIFLMTFLGTTTPLWYIMAALLIIGLGFGLFTSPNTNAIMSSVEKRYYGVASGIVSTMRLLGQMFSMGITMTIFSVIIGKVEITPVYYDEFSTAVHVTFLVFSILCVIGIGASAIRSRG
jgi:EmrB/QacA subfamily drug resistance transporter